VQQDKAVLRKQLLAARSALNADERREAGRLIRDSLLDLPELQMAGTVAAYYSVGAEPDSRGLVYALWKRGTYVLLPLLRSDGDLDWASDPGDRAALRRRTPRSRAGRAARHAGPGGSPPGIGDHPAADRVAGAGI